MTEQATPTTMETIVDCVDLDADLAFFLDVVGCRIHLVTPADDPVEYVVEHPASGGRLRLRRAAADIPVAIRLDAPGTEEAELVAPNGSIVELVSSSPVVGADMPIPDAEPALVVTEASAAGADDGFGVGRAGMTYRDLVPGRWGGRFVASHIRVDHDGAEGDIGDWVHFHRIRFQMIYVASGWVDVVYEDQGPPFRMHAGDCVLQPPEIRHRVLRSSSGLEVIEVGCPAEHDTIADSGLDLPTSSVLPERDFSGQRFVFHRSADAVHEPWLTTGSTFRDTGIEAATDGLAVVHVVRPGEPEPLRSDGEFLLVVGLDGGVEVEVDGRSTSLAHGGSIAIPADMAFRMTGESEVLVVALPAGSLHRG